MGKELADKPLFKPADSQDTAQKHSHSKKGKELVKVYAENIPDYRGKEKIEDLLNFIGKTPSNDTLNKNKKKKSKKKTVHGRPCRSSVESKDEKSELLDSEESTDLYPAKSSSLDKDICCSCNNNSEMDNSCRGEETGEADNSVALNSEYSSPNSAEPFILVEKRSKKRLNASLNRTNKFTPKSPYPNRKLSSSVMHPHQAQHFHCDEKAELDSTYPDLDGSYCKARRNSTGNVHMQMSAVQSVTTEDSDNESWTSLPISQGIQLINEKSYPISYAKIAALSLSSTSSASAPSNSPSSNRNVPCPSTAKAGENVAGCKEATSSVAVKINSVSVSKDNQSRRTSNGNEQQSCCGSDISTENSDNSSNYLLKDNNNKNCLDRRHSVEECAADGSSMKEQVDITTSTPKKLQNNNSSNGVGGLKDNNCGKGETKEEDISFCDHRTSSIYKNIVSGMCLNSAEKGEENINLSLNNLNKAKNFNKSKLVPQHSLVQQQLLLLQQPQQQLMQPQQQQCNIYVNSNNAKCNMANILAVKFINPRDKKHNDKQYKISFGFFYDPDNKNGRNLTGSGATIGTSNSNNNNNNNSSSSSNGGSNSSNGSSSSSSCPLSSELPTSSPAGQFYPNQVSSDKDEDHKRREDKAIISAMKAGCKEGNGILIPSSSQNKKLNPGDEITGKGPVQRLDGNCDSSSADKSVKATEAVKCMSKLNGVIVPNNNKKKNNNSLESYSFRSNAIPESATTTTSSTSSTDNPQTLSPTTVVVVDAGSETPCHLSNIQGNSNIHHHHHHHQQQQHHYPSNKKTIPNTTNCGGNSGDSNVRSPLGDNLQSIPLSYGDKIPKDNTYKVIHFRSEVADTQLFNHQEILSYLSNEYHRVCHLSGPSSIVRVGND